MHCSYIIQHFRDTRRQTIIDLMLGNVKHGDELKFNRMLSTLAQMAEPTITVSDYFHYGALNNELQLTESVVRSARCYSQIIPNAIESIQLVSSHIVICVTEQTTHY